MEEWLSIAQNFNDMWNFPHCLGALDGKHVAVQAPPMSGSFYFNYKGNHSIVLMGLANAHYELIYTDVGCNGRVSDGGVFNQCSLSTAMAENKLNFPPPEPLPGRTKEVPYVIVADNAFTMKPNLLKPYGAKNQPVHQRIFDYRLSRARRIIENVFGIISNRFRVLRQPMLLLPENVNKVVQAICMLHNFLLKRNKSRSIYAPNGAFDIVNGEGEIIHNGTWRAEGFPYNTFTPLLRSNNNNYSENAKTVRDEFRDYFMTTDGEVPWQYKYI